MLTFTVQQFITITAHPREASRSWGNSLKSLLMNVSRRYARRASGRILHICSPVHCTQRE